MTSRTHHAASGDDPDVTRYSYEIDPHDDSTASRVIRLVGEGKRVLELGCAAGHMTKVLKDRGCSVVGIEIDADAAKVAGEFADSVIVGDLDDLDIDGVLGEERFDVIAAADVFEHLHEPERLLRALREHLIDDGYVVSSIPNIAHASVRLALLSGEFRYSDTGLLDGTHVRFFTRETMEEFFADAGFGIASLERQLLGAEDSEVAFDRSLLAHEPIARMSGDPDALAYQFIVTAYPVTVGELAVFRHRFAEVQDARAKAEQKLDQLATEKDRLAHELGIHIEALETELAHLRRHSEEHGQELQQTLDAFRRRLELSTEREGELRRRLLEAQEQLRARDQQILEWYGPDENLRLRRHLDDVTARLQEVYDMKLWKVAGAYWAARDKLRLRGRKSQKDD